MYVTQQESANIGGFLTNSHAKNDKLPINKVPK